MNKNNHRVLAIIPARGGSQRILKKNIKPFLGVPIIKYSIKAALDANIFDEIMVSTDDLEISKISTSFGASVPFIRSEKNSSDTATLSDVLKEVLSEYSKKGKEFDYFCCIYPAAPLINAQILKKALKIINNNTFDAVLPVICYSHPIQRALYINEENMLKMIDKKFTNTRTQDLPKSYYDAGQFFFMRTNSFLKKGKIFTDKVRGIELPQLYAQDIDNDDDWVNAEIKYKVINTKVRN